MNAITKSPAAANLSDDGYPCGTVETHVEDWNDGMMDFWVLQHSTILSFHLSNIPYL
jgi:hypothetical protein